MRFRPREGEVAHWLGLGFSPPEGMHGDKRRGITIRYTTLGTTGTDRYHLGSKSFNRALALQYPRNREHAVMRLLRPQQLDDALWRSVYAIIVAGRPVYIASLIAFLTAITSDDRTAAEAEAVKRYRVWNRLTYRMDRDDGE